MLEWRQEAGWQALGGQGFSTPFPKTVRASQSPVCENTVSEDLIFQGRLTHGLLLLG